MRDRNLKENANKYLGELSAKVPDIFNIFFMRSSKRASRWFKGRGNIVTIIYWMEDIKNLLYFAYIFDMAILRVEYGNVAKVPKSANICFKSLDISQRH